MNVIPAGLLLNDLNPKAVGYHQDDIPFNLDATGPTSTHLRCFMQNTRWNYTD